MNRLRNATARCPAFRAAREASGNALRLDLREAAAEKSLPKWPDMADHGDVSQLRPREPILNEPKPAGTSHVAITEVGIERAAPLRLITLQRPEKLNCLSLEMLDGLLKAVRAGGTPRAVVLMGAGRSFCAGLDLKEIGGASGANRESTNCHLNRLAEVYRWFLKTEIPTVVFARGHAAGGGAGLAACARTVVVAEDFLFKLPGANLAQFAAVALPVLGLRTGRPGGNEFLGQELNAQAALSRGLVDKVVPPCRLTELEHAVRKGILPADLPRLAERSQHAVQGALRELDRVMQELSPSR
jgi:enoyl-CoA hydratase/carnithine racemase